MNKCEPDPSTVIARFKNDGAVAVYDGGLFAGPLREEDLKCAKEVKIFSIDSADALRLVHETQKKGWHYHNDDDYEAFLRS